MPDIYDWKKIFMIEKEPVVQMFPGQIFQK